MRPTEEQLEEIEAEHGKVYLVPFGSDEEAPTMANAEHVFVIRRPGKVAWKRFEKDCLDPKRQLIALQNLAVDCIVWPSPEEREKVYDDVPGAAVLCAGEAASLGRGDAAERAKRFKASTPTPAASR